jgi:hypothetical protein
VVPQRYARAHRPQLRHRHDNDWFPVLPHPRRREAADSGGDGVSMMIHALHATAIQSLLATASLPIVVLPPGSMCVFPH